MSDLVEVARFLDEAQAHVARGVLSGAGIDAVVLADNAGGMRPHLSMASGVRVMVPRADLQKAGAIIAASPDVDEAELERMALKAAHEEEE